MKKDKTLVSIYRFDKTVDNKPRFEKYEVPYKGKRILDVLRYVYETFDPTLAYRKSCGAGVCGCCTIMLNGKPVLPCMELATERMRIEPLPKHEIIRDLVIGKRGGKKRVEST